MQHMTEEAAVRMFEPDAESMPAEQLAGLQQSRLRGLIGRLLAADGVQAGRLRDAGVTGGADVTLADLARLPMTGKDDLWRGYPFGMFAVPREEVVALHGSSGTGGGGAAGAGARAAGAAVIRRDDRAPGDPAARPAAGHPDLHALLRDPARRGAGRGGLRARRRAAAAPGTPWRGGL